MKLIFQARYHFANDISLHDGLIPFCLCAYKFTIPYCVSSRSFCYSTLSAMNGFDSYA